MLASWRYRAGDSTPLDPRIDLNFINGSAFDERITFTRASNAWDFDATGTLVQYAANTPRIAYDASGNILGFHVEESRTNSIRNPRMEGTAAPATVPTAWGIFDGLSSSFQGITTTIVGTGTESGMPYIDVSFSGTATSTTTMFFRCEGNTQIAASNGQTWTFSTYCRVVSGTLANLVPELFIGERSNTGASLVVVTFSFTPSSQPLATQQFSATHTNSNVSTAFMLPAYAFGITSGGTVSCTLRFGPPQMELGAFATSLIMPPAGLPAASTRAVEQPIINPIANWFQPDVSTLFAEYIVPVVPNPGTSQYLADINTDGSRANRIALRAQGGSGSSFSDAAVVVNDVITTGPSAATNAAGTVMKIASTFMSGLQHTSGNGGTIVGSTAPMPVGMDQLSLGFAAGGNQLNGYLRRFQYYPFALTDAQLQQMTT